MKTVRRFWLALLLLLLAGCSGDGLVDATMDAEPLGEEIAVPLLPRIGAAETEALLAMDTDTANEDDAMTLFMGEGRFAEAPDMGTVRCVDTFGNRVPGFFFFAVSTITGRFFYFDDMTGVFTRDRCVLGFNNDVVVEGMWRFLGGDEGEAIWGPYTATISLDDGSFTHNAVIANGTGRFAHATGWFRGIGEMPRGGGDSMFYGKGLISRPLEVVSQGFVMQAASVSQEGSIVCEGGGGPLPGDIPAQFNLEGLATYLGVTAGALVNERCEADLRGLPILSGSWTFTGAQGDVLQGTYTALFTPRASIRLEMIVTGGTGPFEEANGWINGITSLRPNGFDVPLEGLIFLPR